MEASAKLSNCPMSPRKMRLVVDNIRGKSAYASLNMLRFTKKEAALWLHKLLLSAINNWEQVNGQKGDDYDLVVKTAFVDGGTMLKRFQPAPQGRANRIRKRRNHVTIVVTNNKPLEQDN